MLIRLGIELNLFIPVAIGTRDFNSFIFPVFPLNMRSPYVFFLNKSLCSSISAWIIFHKFWYVLPFIVFFAIFICISSLPWVIYEVCYLFLILIHGHSFKIILNYKCIYTFFHIYLRLLKKLFLMRKFGRYTNLVDILTYLVYMVLFCFSSFSLIFSILPPTGFVRFIIIHIPCNWFNELGLVPKLNFSHYVY